MAIRAGILGAGELGRAQAECLASFEDVEIAAVCDSNRERADEIAQSCGASVHINFRTLLESERLDALFVCLPPFARGEPEMLAARAGIHLFMERPVALNVQKAGQVQREIEKSGVVASVACPWRYLSGTDRARGLLKDRKVALVRGWHFGPVPAAGWRRKRESSGGQFVQEATDLVDLARYLVGDIVSVCAMAFDGIAATRLPDYDIEDALAVVLRFRNAAVGEIVSANVAPRKAAALSIVADGLELQITAEALEVAEPGKRTRLEHAGSGMRAAQEAFLEAVKSGGTGLVRCNYGDAVRTLQVALAANESAHTGKIVSV